MAQGKSAWAIIQITPSTVPAAIALSCSPATHVKYLTGERVSGTPGSAYGSVRTSYEIKRRTGSVHPHFGGGSVDHVDHPVASFTRPISLVNDATGWST